MIGTRTRRVIASASLSAAVGCASGHAARASAAPPAPAGDVVTPRAAGGRTLEGLFAGRFAGVSVTPAPNGGLQIRIRGGSNSFYGSNEPLFVVDDTPVAPDAGGIVFLNPYDIARIEVLKNPADVAIYGMRGANGVIKITTTRPGKRGPHA
jgi:TonB-dependent SusC/RagA subfamily outer membrane receptor